MELGLRFIGTIGGVAYSMDRAIARLLPGRLGESARRRPIGVLVAVAALGLLTVIVIFGAVPYLRPTPTDLASLAVPAAEQTDIFTINAEPDRYVSVAGYLAPSYIASFRDENDDHIKQASEVGDAWIYFLASADGTVGLWVDSDVPPAQRPPTGSLTTITGRLSYAFGGVNLTFLNVPNFDLDDLGFPLVKYRLQEGAEFSELGAASDAIVVFGGLAFLLIAAWRLRYLPFRQSGGALGGNPVRATADRPVRARLTGEVEIGGRRQFVRNEEVVARLSKDSFGRGSISLTPFAGSAPVAAIKAGDQFDVGVALTVRSRQYAIRMRDAGRLLVSFDSISERDALVRALLDASP